MKLKIENWDGKAAVKLPELLLQQLEVEIGDVVDVNISRSGIAISRIKPEYKLADLVAQCDINSPRTNDMDDWDKMPPVGKEII